MIPLVTFLFVFGLFFFVFLYTTMRNPIKGIIVGLGGRVNSKGEAVLSLQGRDVYFKYVQGSRNKRPELKVYTYGEFGGDLLIRYETQGDRFYKQTGLNRELQIADREANDQLYFECDDQEFLNFLFLSRNAKSKILDILKSCSDIRISRKQCLLKKYPAPSIQQINQQMVLESAKELLDLCAVIPPKGGEHPELLIFKIKRLFLYGLGSITLAVGLVMWILGATLCRVADPMHLWIASCNVTLISSVGIAVAAFFIIRGFSTSSHVFVYFVCTFSLGLILLGRYGTAVYNSVYDRSAVETFDQAVSTKYTTRSKNSVTYHVVLEPWRSNLSPWSLTVSSSVYARIQPHVTVYRVSTKKGKLGLEWVLSEQLLTDADSSTVNISSNSWPGRDYSNWYTLPVNAQGVDP